MQGRGNGQEGKGRGGEEEGQKGIKKLTSQDELGEFEHIVGVILPLLPSCPLHNLSVKYTHTCIIYSENGEFVTKFALTRT